MTVMGLADADEPNCEAVIDVRPAPQPRSLRVKKRKRTTRTTRLDIGDSHNDEQLTVGAAYGHKVPFRDVDPGEGQQIASSCLQIGKPSSSSAAVNGSRTGMSNGSDLPAPPSRPQGIRSSTFCKVLRLLAGLAPPTARESVRRTTRPDRRPPVWAEVTHYLSVDRGIGKEEEADKHRTSGLYMNKKVAFGYLLEAFPAPRDAWAADGQVIISHGGGQCICPKLPDGSQGSPTLHADQSMSDARVECLLLAAERKTPVVLIAGEGYEHLPWNLGCAYIVLGWYWISYTWVEAEPVGKDIKPPKDRDYHHRYKIRFDWVQSQGDPWWWDTPETFATPFPSSLDDDSVLNQDTASPYTVIQTPTFSHEEKSDKLSYAVTTLSKRSNLSSVMKLSFIMNPEPLGCRDETLNLGHDEKVGDIKDAPRGTTRRRWPGQGTLGCESPLYTSLDEKPTFDLFVTTTCAHCFNPHPQIYVEGPICTTPTCPAFFLLSTHFGLVQIPPGFQLNLHPSFLLPRPTPKSLKNLPYEIIPPEPGGQGAVRQGGDGERCLEVCDEALWKGWVCRECGRANCRYRWEVWECRACGNTHVLLDPNHVVSLSSLSPDDRPFLGDAVIGKSAGISSRVYISEKGQAAVVMYSLPNAGDVYHVMPFSREQADAIFYDYQRQSSTGAASFQRRALKCNSLKGSLLAQHFAINSGVPYKYNVDTLSTPFDKSPTCVIDALHLITERVGAVLGEEIPFNEVLSVMYRQGQKMSWHDDGEPGLGPVVASLSLGSPAIMSFRAKQGQIGGTGTGIVLTFTLSHGDLMIMRGREIQERYQHRVTPQGFRAAATARTISVSRDSQKYPKEKTGES